MKDCLFCKIINGELPSKKVYEDELVTVFLDINPHTNGECLIVPKEHLLDYHDVSDDLNKHMNDVIKKLDTLYREKLNSDGLSIIHNSGVGQEIKHFHIHFIPRYSLTDVTLTGNTELDSLDNIYERIMK